MPTIRRLPLPLKQPLPRLSTPTPAAPTGFYLENGRWSFLNAASYNAIGSFRFWSWDELNPAPGIYRWHWLDQYLE